MTEKEQLQSDIKNLEAQIEPKRKRLNQIYQQEEDIVQNRIKQTRLGISKFNPEELIFAATNRCHCGAGLAYPKNIGINGHWDCSDILLGLADLESKRPNENYAKVEAWDGNHTGELPFSFYEIKSELQPGGATTRPAK